jgi:serine/threonine protein kinase
MEDKSFLKRYAVSKELLGKGGSGQIFKVKNEQDEMFALKIVNKQQILKAKVHNIVEEIRLQQMLEHPNIAQIMEWYEDDANYYIVLELCGRNLYQYNKNTMTTEMILDVVHDVARALTYMHETGIAHRDLKQENVVKCGDVWKLIDFGFATDKEQDTTIIGTMDYIAPEIIKSMVYDPKKLDVWALGVLLYELVYHEPPFIRRTFQDTYKAIRTEEPKYTAVNDRINTIIKAILIKDYKKRPTMLEVMELLE